MHRYSIGDIRGSPLEHHLDLALGLWSQHWSAEGRADQKDIGDRLDDMQQRQPGVTPTGDRDRVVLRW
jgi:hypothetical protein